MNLEVVRFASNVKKLKKVMKDLQRENQDLVVSVELLTARVVS